MILASGYLEADDLARVVEVTAELGVRMVKVEGVKEDRIVFLIEREEAGEVKRELEGLSNIPGVKCVYLAYYSIDGADQEVPPGVLEH